MKKKSLIHVFENGIYPIKIYVVINPTDDFIKENFLNNDDSEIKLDCNYYTMAFVHGNVVFLKSDGKLGILVSIINKNIKVDAMAHEATHVANMIWDWIGENEPSEEANAYLVGYAAKCINNAIKNI